jgi:probable HAF family extracellular repeat protein
MKDLGTLGSVWSYAYGINDLGYVVGSSLIRTSRNYHAFLYSNGSMQDLGTLESDGGYDSQASGINNSGHVVGYSWIRIRDKPDEYAHSFIYSNGSMRDLNNLINPASGWRNTSALAINNAGQIVGEGINRLGVRHAFLLNPVAPVWRQAIETQPVQPTYSEPPKKENAKDSLVVVTHGWQPAWKPVDIA